MQSDQLRCLASWLAGMLVWDDHRLSMLRIEQILVALNLNEFSAEPSSVVQHAQPFDVADCVGDYSVSNSN
jgi:hypothetical protein